MFFSNWCQFLAIQILLFVMYLGIAIYLYYNFSQFIEKTIRELMIETIQTQYKHNEIIEKQKIQISDLQQKQYKFMTFLNNFSIEPSNTPFNKVRLSDKKYVINLQYDKPDYNLMRLLNSLGTEIHFIIYNPYRPQNEQTRYTIEQNINQLTWNTLGQINNTSCNCYVQHFFIIIRTTSTTSFVHLYVMHIIFGSKILLYDGSDVTDLYKICYEKMVKYSDTYYQNDNTIAGMFNCKEIKKIFK